MKKMVRLKNTRHTLELVVLLLVGGVLLVVLSFLQTQMETEKEVKTELVEQNAGKEQTIEAFYAPLDVEEEESDSAVTDLFVLQFPLAEDWNTEPFSSGFVPNEGLGKELVKEYGYKLFIQGLKQDNPYVQWYSAYRLIEFYNSGFREEIMIHLAELQQETPYEEVRAASRFAINVLSNQPEEESRLIRTKEGLLVFTRFFETQLGGGQKVYLVKDNKLSELFVWKDEEHLVGVKHIVLSQDSKYAWIGLQGKEKFYSYIISLQETKYPYYATSQTLFSNDGEQDVELSALNEKWRNISSKISFEDPQQGILEGKWTEEGTLELAYKEQHYTYLPETKELKEGYKVEWDANYDYIAFVKGLEKQGVHVVQKAHYFSSVFTTMREELEIGKESILVYEYASTKEMEKISQAINPLGTRLGDKLISSTRNTHLYKKGRLIVLYYGASKEIMGYLKKELGEQFAGNPSI
ncbi:hypothetical protein CS063_00200 [Sporanaerobium hydrogeniformans]|uniref:Uncharacterized protein n=1 Tax=Sporanaerobium hydrogeniformans TaxID=3072179 RepID=A0AC61DFH5_9FIRM|nr:hypothetical protein [Sporanaerobium hydrogeniformans]PHV71934.1 hypothetical protein CS063_00200 [Sporanaerobium hydrogeniformans]